LLFGKLPEFFNFYSNMIKNSNSANRTHATLKKKKRFPDYGNFHEITFPFEVAHNVAFM